MSKVHPIPVYVVEPFTLLEMEVARAQSRRLSTLELRALLHVAKSEGVDAFMRRGADRRILADMVARGLLSVPSLVRTATGVNIAEADQKARAHFAPCLHQSMAAKNS